MPALTNLHPRLCGPIPRYALLRWAIGGESDCWFWRHFHKLGPCICGCGRLADTYPYGLSQAPLAEHTSPNFSTRLYTDPRTTTAWRKPSYRQTYRLQAYLPSPIIGPTHSTISPCVLCGKGDNCVDHWMRHCLVLPIGPAAPSHLPSSSGGQSSWMGWAGGGPGGQYGLVWARSAPSCASSCPSSDPGP